MKMNIKFFNVLSRVLVTGKLAIATKAPVPAPPVIGWCSHMTTSTGDSMPRMPVTGTRDCHACRLPASEAWSLQCTLATIAPVPAATVIGWCSNMYSTPDGDSSMQVRKQPKNNIKWKNNLSVGPRDWGLVLKGLTVVTRYGYIHTYITICIARCVDSTEYMSNQRRWP